jgi:hypothetical protein
MILRLFTEVIRHYQCKTGKREIEGMPIGAHKGRVQAGGFFVYQSLVAFERGWMVTC